MYDLILVIGGTNQGKSYYVKEAIVKNQSLPVFVYDVQNCYGPKSTKPGDIVTNLPIAATGQPRARWYGDSKTFLQYALKKRNTIIVFEEATAFFEGRTSEDMRKVIINKHHHHNTIICMFHSISSVPPRIMQLSYIVILFKTGDEESEVKRKYSKCLDAFIKLRNAPDRSKQTIKNIQ